MPSTGVMGIQLDRVVVGAIVEAGTRMVVELARTTEVKSNVAVWIARELAPRDDDSLASVRFFTTQVDKAETKIARRVCAFQILEAQQSADRVERRICLGGIGDNDATASLKSGEHPIGDSANEISGSGH